jgi:hypothetical protein
MRGEIGEAAKKGHTKQEISKIDAETAVLETRRKGDVRTPTSTYYFALCTCACWFELKSMSRIPAASSLTYVFLADAGT